VNKGNGGTQERRKAGLEGGSDTPVPGGMTVSVSVFI
jgi:hypothetical protein